MTWDELREEAFGEIGINPTAFYEMDHEDYWLLHKGFFNKRLSEHRLIRWGVTPIVSAWTDKFNPYNNMPLEGDDKLRNQISESNKHRTLNVDSRNLEVLRKFKEAEKNKK